MAEAPWYTQTPVSLSQVSTVNQAAAYAHGAYRSALSKCPNTAPDYKQLRDNIIAGGLGAPLGAPLTMISEPVWTSFLSGVRSKCQNEANSIGTSPPSDAMVTSQPPAQTDPEFSVVKKAGIPWWVWLAGGGVLYLLFKKKGK